MFHVLHSVCVFIFARECWICYSSGTLYISLILPTVCMIIGVYICSTQVDSLFADVHELASYIFDVLKDHLLVFDLKTVQGVRRLESHLM